MIGIKEHYNNFVSDKRNTVEQQRKEVQQLRENKRSLIRKLDAYVGFAKNYADIEVKEVINLTEMPEINWKLNIKALTIANIGVKDFSEILSIIVGTNKRIESLEKVINEFESTIISYEAFAYVLKATNHILIKQLLKGNRVSLGEAVGTLFIHRLKRGKLRPDWNASNKRKAELLAQGKTLYAKVGEDENGEPVYNNGEQWIVYHTEEYYYFVQWNKSPSLKTDEFPLYKKYTFIPTRSKTGLLSIMNKEIAKMPLAHLMFNN